MTKNEDKPSGRTEDLIIRIPLKKLYPPKYPRPVAPERAEQKKPKGKKGLILRIPVAKAYPPDYQGPIDIDLLQAKDAKS